MDSAVFELDRFGRVLIPKAVRRSLGLQPGAKLRATVEHNSLCLNPIESEALLKKERGMLVFVGRRAGAIGNAVEAHRKSRMRELTAGLA